MELILPAVYALLFFFLISRWRFFNIEGLSRRTLCLLFLLKLVAGAAVWLLYTRYYSVSDFHTHFYDSGIFVDRLLGRSTGEMHGWSSSFDPALYNSSRTMILVNAALRIFSFGNFFVHIVFFCFFSFAGSVALLKAFLKHFPQKRMALLVGIFLLPTVLFWGSSVLKESLVIALAGVLMYLCDFGLRRKYSKAQALMAVLVFVLLFAVKMYVALILLPLLLINQLSAFVALHRLWLRAALVLGGSVLLLFVIGKINPDYQLLHLLADKRAKAISEAKGGVFLVSDTRFISVEYAERERVLIPGADSTYRIRNGSNYLSWPLENMSDTSFIRNSADTSIYRVLYAIPPASSVVPMEKVRPELLDFLAQAPNALMNTLFRPSLFDIGSWLHLLVAIENMWLILLIILAILFFDKSLLERKEILLLCILYSVMLLLLIGWTSPVMGAMVRYRTAALLLLVPVLLCAIDERKLRRKLKLEE